MQLTGELRGLTGKELRSQEWFGRQDKLGILLPREPARSLHLHGGAELTTRRVDWMPPPAEASRGHPKMYVGHLLQANEGGDLDAQVGRSGSMVLRDNH